MAKQNKIMFAIHAGKAAGYGHLARCLALSECFIENQYQSSFIIKTDDKEGVHEFLNKRTKYSFDANLINTDNKNYEELKLIQEEFDKKAFFLILDHYDHDMQYRSKLKRKGIRWAQFDYKINEPIIADAVINPNIGVTEDDYKDLVEKKTLLCVGEKYAIIRKELQKVNYNPEPNRILISMGGGDYPDVVIDIIKLTVSEKSFKYDVITNCNLLIDNIRQYDNVSVHINPNNIGEIYSHCKAAIVAGGVTSHELAFIEIPMIIVPFADNQAKIAEKWNENYFGINFQGPITYKKSLLEKSINSIVYKLDKHHNKRILKIDNKGTERIVRSIIKNVFN